MRFLKSLCRAGLGQFRFFLVVLLGYLLQMCLMPYLRIGTVTPSLLCAMIAIITVGYDKLRAVWVGCIYGILMETMCPTITLLNLFLYPLSAFFLCLAFSDKSEKKLEAERSLGKEARNINPYLRTLGCAAANIFLHETVNVVYIYLGGAEIGLAAIGKAVSNVLWTTVLTGIIMVPVRRFLGFKKLPREPRSGKPQYHIGRA